MYPFLYVIDLFNLNFTCMSYVIHRPLLPTAFDIHPNRGQVIAHLAVILGKNCLHNYRKLSVNCSDQCLQT
jgi:hypothetical protein